MEGVKLVDSREKSSDSKWKEKSELFTRNRQREAEEEKATVLGQKKKKTTRVRVAVCTADSEQLVLVKQTTPAGREIKLSLGEWAKQAANGQVN